MRGWASESNICGSFSFPIFTQRRELKPSNIFYNGGSNSNDWLIHYFWTFAYGQTVSMIEFSVSIQHKTMYNNRRFHMNILTSEFFLNVLYRLETFTDRDKLLLIIISDRREYRVVTYSLKNKIRENSSLCLSDSVLQLTLQKAYDVTNWVFSLPEAHLS